MNTRTEKGKFDLEERLIEFAAKVFEIVDSVFDSKAGNHIAGQLVRSGSNPALHYGEAQSAESRKDFIHKLQVLLKELKESRAVFKLIIRVPLSEKIEFTKSVLSECEELISIFAKSISTAKENMRKELIKSVK